MNIDLADLQMAIVSAVEGMIIIAIIPVVIFGAKKIPELARSFGRAPTEFEKARLKARIRARVQPQHLQLIPVSISFSTTTAIPTKQRSNYTLPVPNPNQYLYQQTY